MTTSISEFEVLFSGLIPGVPLPLVAQGYFIQITNVDSMDHSINLNFNETTNFANASFSIASMDFNLLVANYLDGSGNANPYDSATFIANSGFEGINIPSGETFVFGLQAFPVPAATLPDASPAKNLDARKFVAPASIPNFGIQWHGTVNLSCSDSSASPGYGFLIYPTTRGVFFDPIIEDAVDRTSSVLSLGITTGQTYSAVPTIDGTCNVALPA